MTDFRACGTIMGPAGLTAVFGMGTGVAPPVWSPERRPGAGQGPAGRDGSVVVRTGRWSSGQGRDSPRPDPLRIGIGDGIRLRASPVASRPGRRSRGGSGWSSRSAVRTGRLRRSPAVHARPIDLVVFQEPSGP